MAKKKIEDGGCRSAFPALRPAFAILDLGPLFFTSRHDEAERLAHTSSHALNHLAPAT